MECVFYILEEIDVVIDCIKASQEPNEEMVQALKDIKASAYLCQKELDRLTNESNRLRSTLDGYRTVTLDLAYTNSHK